jgi:DNA modification methylase
VTKTEDGFPVARWQRYASPVWMDINPSETLQGSSAREEADERHIAPLQLEVIQRAIELWTNPGDVVLDPFGGIGSSGFVAVKEGRRTVMVELKASYFGQMVRNIERAESEIQQVDLFSWSTQQATGQYAAEEGSADG